MTQTANTGIDDAILVRRWQGGDREAAAGLISRYQDRVYTVILRMCGNAEDAAELTQDTFVKVLENIKGFEGRSLLYTWIFRIATNLTLNHCRRTVLARSRGLDTPGGWSDFPVESAVRASARGHDPAAAAAGRELVELARKALLDLDEDRRFVVILRDMEGMSYAQISEVLDVETGTVKSRLARARDSLRKALGGAV